MKFNLETRPDEGEIYTWDEVLTTPGIYRCTDPVNLSDNYNYVFISLGANTGVIQCSSNGKFINILPSPVLKSYNGWDTKKFSKPHIKVQLTFENDNY